MNRRILLLFGAGASTYSESNGAAAPPLGNALFEQLKAAGYVRSDLPADVLEAFAKPDGFEIGMSRLAKHGNVEYSPFLRGMAKYFAPFVGTGQSHYLKLFAALSGTRARVFVATLNYDNLIEHALLRAGNDPAVVLKPHGSCGYLPDFGSNIVINNVFASGRVEGLLQGNMRTELVPEKIIEWCDNPNNASFAPAMSFYAPGKATAVNRRQIEAQREEWKKRARHVEVCFVIGVRCNPDDDHIWGPLAESRCRLIYVNPSDAGFSEWQREHKRRYADHRPIGFAQAIPEIVTAAAVRF